MRQRGNLILLFLRFLFFCCFNCLIFLTVFVCRSVRYPSSSHLLLHFLSSTLSLFPSFPFSRLLLLSSFSSLSSSSLRSPSRRHREQAEANEDLQSKIVELQQQCLKLKHYKDKQSVHVQKEIEAQVYVSSLFVVFFVFV